MRQAVWLPLFDAFADPACVAELAATAEEAGWDGFFVWDHIRWRERDRHVGDAWISLAGAALSTERLRLGAMVTPLPRYRPADLARRVAALDHLSNGRLTFGAGLGSDRFAGEYRATGETTDPRTHAAMTDESLAILRAAWTGRTVDHHGTHHTVDQVRFLPRPRQATLPIWIAGTGDAPRPRLRAAGHQGFVPVNLVDADQLAAARADIGPRLPAGAPFDYAATLPFGTDGDPYRRAGATWCLREVDTHRGRDRIRDEITDGPPA